MSRIEFITKSFTFEDKDISFDHKIEIKLCYEDTTRDYPGGHWFETSYDKEGLDVGQIAMIDEQVTGMVDEYLESQECIDYCNSMDDSL